MENSSEGYHISFFKPTTERARYNRNMVIWLVSIWFIAIFGFQILLKVIGKPVPQAEYLSFENAWSNIDGGNHTGADLQELAASCLSVLGKITLAPEDKPVLDDAFSWCVYHLSPEGTRQDLLNEIVNYRQTSAGISTIEDPEYIRSKSFLSVKISPLLGISEYDVRRNIIPFALEAEGMGEMKPETKGNLPAVMEKYLVHNQSVLTDIKFLGFPFHYFYTAVFLLILFVGLCWLYCVRIDARNKKLGFSD
ncbi:MAG TPA: DUF4212 domain-containing protein [Bacteroides sp.]|nr:DUF4212 domain-containing protein [Bacteroides sp.]